MVTDEAILAALKGGRLELNQIRKAVITSHLDTIWGNIAQLLKKKKICVIDMPTPPYKSYYYLPEQKE